jgi:hypothetical protein
MNGFEGLWGYLVLVLVGFLPADVWRLLGVIIGAGSMRNPSSWFGSARWRQRSSPA